jgi:hypothetical protein
VYGSVLLVDGAGVAVGVVVVAASDDGLAALAAGAGGELEEPLLEDVLGAAGAEDEDELGADVVVVEVSGSTYCWSPADVLVPPWA